MKFGPRLGRAGVDARAEIAQLLPDVEPGKLFEQLVF